MVKSFEIWHKDSGQSEHSPQQIENLYLNPSSATTCANLHPMTQFSVIKILEHF